jgi:transposase InsO family protein
VQHEPSWQLKRKPLSLRWDNAPVESFFGTLKQELVNRCRFTTREVARREVFSYIEV